MVTATPSSSAPPIVQNTPVAWVKKNLFNNWFNSTLTVLIAGLIGWVVVGFVGWAIAEAKWDVLSKNWPLFFVGQFPREQYWQMFLLLALVSALSGLSWGYFAKSVAHFFSAKVLLGLGIITFLAVLTPTPLPFRLLLLGILLLGVTTAWGERQLSPSISLSGQVLSLCWLLFLIIGFWLIRGGLGLEPVSSNDWGGLLLTLVIALVSILLCFPMGLLLALGRQSPLPVISWISTTYIEVIRGVPLISILFMGQVMIPLFLPDGMRPDRVLRAILALTLFSAAYMAENIRGGLQAVPRGQYEAASCVGLNTPFTLILIIMPQALKISIPAIVGQFISLFQDTTLVSIVGLKDLLGMSRGILGNPEFLGRYQEVYLFIAIIYWIFCYAMSLGSRQIEKNLETGH
ncbi:MAG: amino acid ABC transporter permease [Merismopedia sp. SIO2A8]|nr:amino acid ABC transporter permease [Merismopedia sp. SIO2A8]